MATLEYLDEERVKLWTNAKALENRIEQTRQDLSAEIKKAQDGYASALRAQKQYEEETRKIAVSKTTEDAELVMRTAQEVIAKKAAVFEQLKDTEDARKQLSDILAAFKRIKKLDSQSQEIGERVKTVSEEISAKGKESEKNSNLALVCLGQVQKAAREADGVFSSATKQAQNIQDINEQVGNILSKLKASFETIQEEKELVSSIGVELTKLKEDQESAFSEFQSKSDKTISSLYKAKEIQLQRLHSTNQAALKQLHEEYSAKLEALTSKIEKLLPGGTSIALSSAFEKRKQAVEKYKWVWGLLLGVSALGLVAFGVISLFFNETFGLTTSLSARFVVVGGLVVLEEFSRRNFNVSSRLAEAYAYKEALAKSYTGYKSELQDINMPIKSGEGGPSSSVLVKTFLDKLADEPGKRVFDRERTALGLTGFLDHVKTFPVVQPQSDSADETSQGNPPRTDKNDLPSCGIFRKVSWPVVSLFGIAAVMLCIIVWIISTSIVASSTQIKKMEHRYEPSMSQETDGQQSP